MKLRMVEMKTLKQWMVSPVAETPKGFGDPQGLRWKTLSPKKKTANQVFAKLIDSPAARLPVD